MNKVKQLPEYPSELLQLALDDIAVIKKNKKYKIDVEIWHSPNDDTDKCEVCLAGAVLANTLKLDREITVVIALSDENALIGEKNTIKLRTIDSLRELEIYDVYENYKKPHGYGQRLTFEHVELLEKYREKIYKKFEATGLEERDIKKFKNFKVSHDFYSSIVEDLVELDKEILGRKQ